MADRQTEAYHLVSKNVNSQNTGEKRLFRMSLPMCRVSKTDDDRTLKKKKKTPTHWFSIQLSDIPKNVRGTNMRYALMLVWNNPPKVWVLFSLHSDFRYLSNGTSLQCFSILATRGHCNSTSEHTSQYCSLYGLNKTLMQPLFYY